MASHSSHPQHPRCGQRPSSCNPSSATPRSSLLPVTPTGNAIRSSNNSDRSRHVPRFPLSVVTSSRSAENRNTHRPSSATTRGFVPRGLSYAKRASETLHGGCQTALADRPDVASDAQTFGQLGAVVTAASSLASQFEICPESVGYRTGQLWVQPVIQWPFAEILAPKSSTAVCPSSDVGLETLLPYDFAQIVC